MFYFYTLFLDFYYICVLIKLFLYFLVFFLGGGRGGVHYTYIRSCNH